MDLDSLKTVLAQVLTSELQLQPLSPLKSVADRLLCGSISPLESGDREGEPPQPGWPTEPLYLEISMLLVKWSRLLVSESEESINSTPFRSIPDFRSRCALHMLEEVEAKYTVPSDAVLRLHDTSAKWADLSDNEKVTCVRCLLLALGVDCLTILVGMRRTAGSIIAFPPPLDVLLASFNKDFNPTTKSKLSVGARALMKHAQRSSDLWWGHDKGSESDKNERALVVIKRILSNPVWMNAHILPHDTYVFEIRQEEGYGARWTADGTFFRGFLEPQMEEGHSVGWKH